ncbi:MAG: hypothetical protein A2V87_04245 [Deltaproteobacteria bacterium RBG_16_58_17]|nr:MAG: hypothetical protein A2V87_04245 [Deltaproteobacteria bacterium RBG_16_58_17]OHE21654.1 MAG: hypothetical protein A2X95_09530 [Syntrophobacterales bacterium GWF2_56_9]
MIPGKSATNAFFGPDFPLTLFLKVLFHDSYEIIQTARELVNDDHLYRDPEYSWNAYILA